MSKVSVERKIHWGDALLARIPGKPTVFTEGFGNRNALDEFCDIVKRDDQTVVDVQLIPEKASYLGNSSVGRFESVAPELPEAFRRAEFKMIAPRNQGVKGYCIILPSLGDSKGALARLIAWPLIRSGVAVILPQIPFYSSRQIEGVERLGLTKFSNQLYMGGAVVSETRSIIHWLHAQNKKVALAGYSMGGFLSAYTLAGLKLPVPGALGATAIDPGRAVFGGFLSQRFSGLDQNGTLIDEIRHSLGQVALSKFPLPAACDQVTLIACLQDGVIANSEVESLHTHWQGSKLVTLNSGHVSGMFRVATPIKNAVLEAFSRD